MSMERLAANADLYRGMESDAEYRREQAEIVLANLPVLVRCEGCSMHVPVEGVTVIGELPWCAGCATCSACAQPATALDKDECLACEAHK